MKKLLLCIQLLWCALFAAASTDITTATVSGHWTTAGSPYYIYNDIAVSPNTVLRIDPGVEVVFRGLNRLQVKGALYAVGTVALPISFKAYDTTGWHDDGIPAGGWRGIQYEMFASSGADSSAFEYCNVTDMKYGSSSTIYPGYNTGCFFADSNRRLNVKHCNFFHNIAENGYVRNIILYGMQTMEDCNIHDNRAYMNIVSLSLYHPLINNCKIYNNVARFMVACEMLYLGAYQFTSVLNCDIYDNTTTLQGGQVHVNTGHALIKGCKIHNNVNPDDGAIYCVGGQVEIADNLICNNKQTVPVTCGALEGGGAMHLCFNISTSSADSTSFLVRNNVIANNYSAGALGAGIYIWHANTWIMNNTIINNVGGGPNGAAIGMINMGSSVYIKNNIIYNNRMGSAHGYYAEVGILNADTVFVESNWMQYPYYQTLGGSSYIPAGDSATNLIADDPYLLNPTDTASPDVSALGSDFSLTASSLSCINKGDNADCFASTTDYAGAPRIAGGIIDIGAFEYQGVTHVGAVTAKTAPIYVYPNPASTSVTVVLPVSEGSLKLMDITGRVVAAQQVATGTEPIDLSTCAKGIYMVEWLPVNGSAQRVKVVVE